MYGYFYGIGNHMESNVNSLCGSEVTRKIKQRIRGYFYNEMRYINLRFT